VDAQIAALASKPAEEEGCLDILIRAFSPYDDPPPPGDGQRLIELRQEKEQLENSLKPDVVPVGPANTDEVM
jgi:hypothetical protein